MTERLHERGPKLLRIRDMDPSSSNKRMPTSIPVEILSSTASTNTKPPYAVANASHSISTGSSTPATPIASSETPTSETPSCLNLHPTATTVTSVDGDSSFPGASGSVSAATTTPTSIRALGPNFSVSPISTDDVDIEIATPDVDLKDRRSKIATLLEEATISSKEGDAWFLIPRDFLEDVLNLPVETFQELKQEVGVLDVTSIVDRNGNLYAESDEPVDTYNIPPKVFDILAGWFGIRGQPVSRILIYNPETGRKEVERFPSYFHIHTLQKTGRLTQTLSSSSTNTSQGVFCSTTGTFLDLFEAIRIGFLKTPKKKSSPSFPFRIWFVSTDSLPNTILISTFINDIPKKQLVLQNRYNQRLKDQGLTSPEYHILVELEEKGSTHLQLLNGGFLIDNYFQSIDLSTNFDINWILHHGGNRGLTNLGNTCYMNSALQCLLHIQEINDYFFFKIYEQELNETNPLGFRGQIAVLFGNLLKKLFGPIESNSSNTSTTSSTSSSKFGGGGSSSNSAVSPRDFKYAVGHHSSLFQGYQQQDSQEFLSWLLDALHEDLNRIYEKPYCEKPELGDNEIEDVHAIEGLAATCWNQHKQRNDLVITDLFTGMYKSTLVCPECSKTSITFDPFNDVTLPLPVNKKWYHTFKFVNLGTTAGGIHSLEVELSKTSNYDDLIKYVSDHLKVLPDNIFLFEIFNNFFYKDFQSNYNKLRYYPISEVISDHDDVVIYHIPHDPKKDIIVPVINTVADVDGSYNVVHAFGLPLFVLFDANSEITGDLVREALEEKVKLLLNNTEIENEKIDLSSSFKIKYYMETKYSLRNKVSNSMIHIPHNRANLNNLPNLIAEVDKEVEGNEDLVIDTRHPVSELSDIGAPSDSDEFVVANSIDSIAPAVCKVPSDLTPQHLDVGEDVEEDVTMPEANDDVASSSDSFNNLGLLFDSVDTLDNNKAPSSLSTNTSGGDLNDLYKMTLICQWDHDQYVKYFTDDTANHAWVDPKKIPNPDVDFSKSELLKEQNSTVSLYDCFTKFSSPEILGDQDLWYCPRCQDHKQATKTIQLWSTGDILTIHLKRFESARSFSDKIDMVVDFPIEGLDMLEFVNMDTNDGDSLIYDLIGVDNHYGGLGVVITQRMPRILGIVNGTTLTTLE